MLENTEKQYKWQFTIQSIFTYLLIDVQACDLFALPSI